MYLNRGRFIICCIFVPVAIILSFTESILLTMGQDPEVCRFAGMYVRYYLPGLLLQMLNDAQVRFLNCLGKTMIPLLAQGIGVVLHLFWMWYLVIHLDIGLKGIAIAEIITNGTVLALGIFYAR